MTSYSLVRTIVRIIFNANDIQIKSVNELKKLHFFHCTIIIEQGIQRAEKHLLIKKLGFLKHFYIQV